jgi:hypothetical protein
MSGVHSTWCTPCDAAATRRCKNRGRLLAFVVATFLAGARIAPATAMTIDVTYGSGVTTDMQTAFGEVVSAYDAAFANDITLQIGLQGERGSRFLGKNTAATGEVSYVAWYSAMTAYQASGLDNPSFTTAYQSLPASSALGTDGGVILRTANLSALGFTPNLSGTTIDGFTGVDGVITINAGLPLAIPSGGTVPSGSYDLVAALEHELDEVLGIGSGLTDGTYPTTPEAYDYFRYSSAGMRSWSPSASSAYFSIDGGITNLANFNQNSAGDYNDWVNGACPASTPLSQNAFACTDQVP